MEPLLAEGAAGLDDGAVALIAGANRLAGRVRPILHRSVGALVRSVDCCYSGLIEGRSICPGDIERALSGTFSNEPVKRALQLEAAAQFHVLRLIDEGRDPAIWPASGEYAQWLHREFCGELPPGMPGIENSGTGGRAEVVPGELRSRDVVAGRHGPPPAADLRRFLLRFEQTYASPRLSRFRQIQSVGAVHRTFLWIHPFAYGNGAVARLMSHALFKRLGLDTGLWSVARGLAHGQARYRVMLTAADGPRRGGERDGYGKLTQEDLAEFCRFFLERAVDQVRFMEKLLDPDELLGRMKIHVAEELQARRLPKGSFMVLREAVLAGEVGRGKVPALTGHGERAARMITSALVERGMLAATSHRAPLRLAFPVEVAERWFPGLYPASIAGRGR